MNRKRDDIPPGPAVTRTRRAAPMIERASLPHLPYIVHLSKLHAEELGFLPREAMASYLERGRVTLARENGEPCGYFLTSALQPQTRIFQAAVQLDARGLGHARTMLGDLIARAAIARCTRITLHCRDGLASNGFWTACGFTGAGLILGGRARGKIVLEWQLSIADALDNPALPYAGHFLAKLRVGAISGTRSASSPRVT